MVSFFHGGCVTNVLCTTGESTVDTLSGRKLVQRLYMPWGENRNSKGTLPTTVKYTGQQEEAGIGLYYYKARWYDSALGRFAQADTIVPLESQGVQAWDRYGYVNNNPVKYNDPTGHMCNDPEDRTQHCDGYNDFQHQTKVHKGNVSSSTKCSADPDKDNDGGVDLGDALEIDQAETDQTSGGCNGLTLLAGGAIIAGGVLVASLGGYLVATGAAHSSTIVGAILGVHEIAIGGIMVGIGLGGIFLGGNIIYQSGCIPFLRPKS